jgi:hypothetical protein
MIPWTQQQGEAVPRPATGETPIRHVRIADKVWDEISQIAHDEGRTVTAVVLDALNRYLTWHKRQPTGSARAKS